MLHNNNVNLASSFISLLPSSHQMQYFSSLSLHLIDFTLLVWLLGHERSFLASLTIDTMWCLGVGLFLLSLSLGGPLAERGPFLLPSFACSLALCGCGWLAGLV